MGGSQSNEKPDYMSYMARLSVKDYKNDEKFWTELISLAPSRFDVHYPYPRLMNEIAVKYPQNFLRLVLICVQHVNLLKDGVSVSIFPDMILDQFFLSLLIFITCFEALIYNEKLIPLLNRLDISLAQAYIKARPHLESYILLSQRKKQEQPNEPKEDNSNQQDANQLKSITEIADFPKPAINPIFASMQRHEGHVINSMISCLSSCMFKVGLTLENQEKDWNQSTNNYLLFNTSRRDVIHCIYFLNSLDYFLSDKIDSKPHFQIEMPDFPYSEFFKSTCIVAAKYHMNSYQNIIENETYSLLLNCFGLLMQLFNTQALTNAFSQVDPLILLQAFVLKDTPDAPLLFQSSDLLANESLTFLYMSLFYQPNLSLVIANEGLSSKFIFTLIEACQLTYEKVGVCYLHTIIVSSILFLISDENIVSTLNNHFNQAFTKCQLHPYPGSYADVLLEVLFNLSDLSSSNFSTALAAVFQMMVPQVYCFSIKSAERLVNLFDRSIKSENKELVELLLEAFAEIVQNKINNQNMIPATIVKNASIFEDLKGNSKFDIDSKPLDIMLSFISAVKNEIQKSNNNINDINIIISVLKSLDISQIFTNTASFMKHPQILNDDVNASWINWSYFTFEKAFEKELERLNSLKVELNMQEQQIQYMMKQQQQLQEQELEKQRKEEQKQQQTNHEEKQGQPTDLQIDENHEEDKKDDN